MAGDRVLRCYKDGARPSPRRGWSGRCTRSATRSPASTSTTGRGSSWSASTARPWPSSSCRRAPARGRCPDRRRPPGPAAALPWPDGRCSTSTCTRSTCHGPGRPVVIDWTNARPGPPGLDVAIAALILASVSLTGEVPAADELLTAYAAAAPAPYATTSRTPRPCGSPGAHQRGQRRLMTATVASPAPPPRRLTARVRPALRRGAGPIGHHRADRGARRPRGHRARRRTLQAALPARRRAGHRRPVHPGPLLRLLRRADQPHPRQAPEWADALRRDGRQVADRPLRRRQDGRDPAPARLGDAPGRAFVCIVRDLEPVAASWEARARTPRTWAGAPTRTPPGRSPPGTAPCAGSAAPSSSAPTTRSSSSTTASSVTPRAPSLGRVLDWLGLDRTDGRRRGVRPRPPALRRARGAQAAHPARRRPRVPRRARRARRLGAGDLAAGAVGPYPTGRR